SPAAWADAVGDCKDGKDPDRQIASCTRAISEGASDKKILESVYANRGNGYVAKGDFRLAIADFDVVIRLNPNLAPPYSNRGNAFSAKNDFDRAMRDYDQAIRLIPNQPQLYLNRGNGHFARKELALAIKDYDQAIALAPNFALAFKNRGISKLQSGDTAGGNADLARAKQLDPRL